jgi:cytochrome bd-type quinol oxidase subunit 2
MSILNGEVLITYFPAALLLITFEVIMSIYKSDVYQWTAKHAVGNLFVNLMWIVLILVVAMDPKLFNPEFAKYLAGTYNSTSEKMTDIIQLVMNAVVCLVVVTNIIDTYSGFNMVKEKEKEKSDQI